MIFNRGRHEHVTRPCLIQLHWLPVRFRITYKLCILIYNIRAGKCACYLRDIMQPTIARATRSSLRSDSDTTSYVTPRLRTKFGERAFSFSGPAAWNSLRTELRTVTVSDITDFKNKSKAHFSIGFWHSVNAFIFYYHILVFAVICLV